MCNGDGNITKHIRLGPITQIINEKCLQCNGSGQTRSNNINCNNCNSTGFISIQQLVEINKALRKKGMGPALGRPRT